ncbi:MAG: hypothetical protein LBH00_00900 [Planctomycetaceae bacterium]|jgi:hypothetical protein|nr:hypothetical protein [Planctomycetaceae bacterium]
MRKKRSVPSSLELFLDTICNVFGGILFIAILLAILIRQTEGVIKKPEDNTPEKIAELQQQLDQISADIAASEVLIETLHASIPKPKDTAEQQAAELFFKLLSAKGTAAVKQAELVSQQLAAAKELLELQKQAAQMAQQIQQLEQEKQKLDRELTQHQQDKHAIKTSSEKLQSEIDELEQQIAQKEKNIKNNETKTERNEVLYLPKLQDAGAKRPIYFVLRFNRFYVVSRREDFDYKGNELGVPKTTRGIPADDAEALKKQILPLLGQGQYAHSVNFPSVFVYGDSAEQFHIIRDIFISAGFKYELIPTADDDLWQFGGGGESRDVLVQ